MQLLSSRRTPVVDLVLPDPRLRKIESNPAEPWIIATERGVAYRVAGCRRGRVLSVHLPLRQCPPRMQ